MHFVGQISSQKAVLSDKTNSGPLDLRGQWYVQLELSWAICLHMRRTVLHHSKTSRLRATSFHTLYIQQI